MVNHIQRQPHQHSSIIEIIHTTDNQTSTPTHSIKPLIEYDPRCGLDQINHHLVKGYKKLVTDRVDEGRTCDLLTFLFSQLPGRQLTVAMGPTNGHAPAEQSPLQATGGTPGVNRDT
jgi:hypothetical protein